MTCLKTSSILTIKIAKYCPWPPTLFQIFTHIGHATSFPVETKAEYKLKPFPSGSHPMEWEKRGGGASGGFSFARGFGIS